MTHATMNSQSLAIGPPLINTSNAITLAVITAMTVASTKYTGITSLL